MNSFTTDSKDLSIEIMKTSWTAVILSLYNMHGKLKGDDIMSRYKVSVGETVMEWTTIRDRNQDLDRLGKVVDVDNLSGSVQIYTPFNKLVNWHNCSFIVLESAPKWHVVENPTHPRSTSHLEGVPVHQELELSSEEI